MDHTLISGQLVNLYPLHSEPHCAQCNLVQCLPSIHAICAYSTGSQHPQCNQHSQYQNSKGRDVGGIQHTNHSDDYWPHNATNMGIQNIICVSQLINDPMRGISNPSRSCVHVHTVFPN